MAIEKLFNFTQQLERNLEQLLKVEHNDDQKKLKLLKNIEVVSKFNKVFLNGSNELNRHDVFSC